jgi:putative endonuclease
MSLEKKNFGAWGEDVAVAYLERNGYRILSRNYRVGHKELDVVATRDDLTIFVEVKTRQEILDGVITGILKREQSRNLRFAISGYAYQFRIDLEKTRLDLIVIDFKLSKKTAKISHYYGV